MVEPRSILITGASSGIGAALAEAYAAPGVRLALSGRAADRLDALAARCRDKGAAVSGARVDVADRGAMAAWLRTSDDAHPLDLVFANAGISSMTSGVWQPGDPHAQAGLNEEVTYRMVRVNFEGVLNTVLPILPRMRERGRGQLVLISSLAAYVPYPGGSVYGATKAAMKYYGEALRLELGNAGIGVTVVCPGFVRSRMTASLTRAPLMKDAPAAANLIKRRLRRNPPVIAFPQPLLFPAWIIGALPARLRHALLHRRR